MRDSAPKFGPIPLGIVLATLFTAGVHGYLFAKAGPSSDWLPWGFLAAMLGFLGSLAAMYAPIDVTEGVRSFGRFALLGVTIATMVGYVIQVGWEFDTLAIADKVDESVLVVLIVVDALTGTRGVERGEDRSRAAFRPA